MLNSIRKSRDQKIQSLASAASTVREIGHQLTCVPGQGTLGRSTATSPSRLSSYGIPWCRRSSGISVSRCPPALNIIAIEFTRRGIRVWSHEGSGNPADLQRSRETNERIRKNQRSRSRRSWESKLISLRIFLALYRFHSYHNYLKLFSKIFHEIWIIYIKSHVY